VVSEIARPMLPCTLPVAAPAGSNRRHHRIAKYSAIMAVLSLYSLSAFAQSQASRPESKAEDFATSASTASDPPICSIQTPCIEDPVTGKRYQFDSSGKMTIIE